MYSPFPHIQRAVKLADTFGMIDGAHHKQWVVDQMVRALLTPEQYVEWRDEFRRTGVEWDEGIAP